MECRWSQDFDLLLSFLCDSTFVSPSHLRLLLQRRSYFWEQERSYYMTDMQSNCAMNSDAYASALRTSFGAPNRGR